jgi:voltage-gated potassium channel
LRLVRIFSVRRLLSLDGIKYTGLIAGLTVVVGGAAFASIETHEGHVLTTWDGVWWAVTTVTTVGYGDIAPETDGGRIVAMMIMLVGIGFVALLTAFIADRFISEQKTTESKEDQILEELRLVNQRLDNLERVDVVTRH